MLALEQFALVEILSFVAGGVLLVGMGAIVSTLLRPHHPNPTKLSTYESGEVAVGTAWAPFNARLYAVAIVFVLFEVEAVLLFPWATVWNNAALNAATGGLWKYYTAFSAFIFVTLLAIGLAYVWRRGCLQGLQPPPPPSVAAAPVPQHVYEQVNQRYANAGTASQNRCR